MGRNTTARVLVAALAGGALLFSSAGACGPSGDGPGVSNQQDGDDEGGQEQDDEDGGDGNGGDGGGDD